MEIITYLQLFASFWCNAILFFAPGIIRYRQFALVMAFVSAASILIEVVFIRRMKLPKTTAISFVIYLLIIVLYGITPQFYRDTHNESYVSFYLVLAGQVFPAAVSATIVADDNRVQERIKKLVPYVSIIFCLLSFAAIFFPTSITSGGLSDNENGLNYQSASYLAAYAAVLGEYYLLTRDKEYNSAIMRSKAMTIAMVISILADFVTILVSGGRGGLAAFVIGFALTFYVMLLKGSISKGGLVKLIFTVIIIAVIGYVGIRFAANTSVATSGMDRLIYFFKYGNTVGDLRSAYRRQAIEAFESSPIIGHGFGSIYYEMGRYSHSCFYDALAEVGIVGTIVFLLIIFKTFICGIKAIKRDTSESLWIYFFLCGFSVSLFSNYYLSHVPMYWGISFIFASDWLFQRRLNVEETNEDFQ